MTTLMSRAATVPITSSTTLAAAESTAGSPARARASARRRFSPPDIVRAGRSPNSESPTSDSNSAIRESYILRGNRPETLSAYRRFSAAVRLSMTGCWNTIARRTGATLSRPPQVTVPAEGNMSPIAMRRSVVLHPSKTQQEGMTGASPERDKGPTADLAAGPVRGNKAQNGPCIAGSGLPAIGNGQRPIPKV